MKTFRWYLLLVILTLLTSVFWQQGYAEVHQRVELDLVEVNLWPEYERSAMLVTQEIRLSESISLPREMIFQIPSNVELIHLACLNEDGSLDFLESDVTSVGDWQDVKLVASSQRIQLEYHVPNSSKQGEIQHFEFKWRSIYSVDDLTVKIHFPPGAQDISAMPSLGSMAEGDNGEDFYSGNFGAVPAGEEFSLSLNYIRSAEDLSYPVMNVVAGDPITKATPGRTPSPFNVVIWLLAVAMAVLILVGLYYWWFQANVTHKTDQVVQGVGITNPEKSAVFCHECGMRSRVSDTYCRNCGTELRQRMDYERIPGI